jgi:oligopeptide/dipeptide ABC transporter ATP-binding protein
MMDRPLLEVENLQTYFFTKRGLVKAVDDVTFSINERESMGIVGESGCGKTITCLSILRLVPEPAGKIVGGKIFLKGENLLEKSEAEMRKIRGSRISMILQDPLTSLNPAYTIGDQVSEVIKLHQNVKGKAAVLEKVIDSLKRVRIPAAAERVGDYPHQMSGGMRQRVAGGIAISCYPSLLIADEPTTSLDVTTQAAYLRLLKQVQEETKAAMIFITHDLGIVARSCDKVCVMYMGRLVETGKVREVWNNPRHPYSIALLKSIPHLEEKVSRLYSIEGAIPSHFDIPSGCVFHPRCEVADEHCKQEFPPPVTLAEGHVVRCWRVQE